MGDTHFQTKNDKGEIKSDKNYCFAPVLSNIRAGLYPGLEYFSLNNGPNAAVYKHPWFLELVSKSFPEGLVSEDGWVKYKGFKGDLVAYALITLRHPGEYEYANLLPKMYEGIQEAYKDLGPKPPFELSNPFTCALLNIPSGVKGKKIIPYASDGHAAVHWGSLDFDDLYYLTISNVFEGVQPVIDGENVITWKSGYSSVARKRKLLNSYISSETNPFTKKLRDIVSDDGLLPKDLYGQIFQWMVENKPAKVSSKSVIVKNSPRSIWED